MTADNAKKTSRFVKLATHFTYPLLPLWMNRFFNWSGSGERGYYLVWHWSGSCCKWNFSSLGYYFSKKIFWCRSSCTFGNNPYVLAWPSSESGALPLEGGVAVHLPRKLQVLIIQIKKKGNRREMAKKQNPFSKRKLFCSWNYWPQRN